MRELLFLVTVLPMMWATMGAQVIVRVIVGGIVAVRDIRLMLVPAPNVIVITPGPAGVVRIVPVLIIPVIHTVPVPPAVAVVPVVLIAVPLTVATVLITVPTLVRELPVLIAKLSVVPV